MIECFSTHESTTDCKLDYWNELLGETYVGLVADSKWPHFEAQMHRWHLADMTMIRPKSSAVFVARRPEQIGNQDTQKLILHVMHSGQCELTQRDRKTPMHMGDMVVCASEEHYSIDMADRHEMLVLELDRSTIGERVPNLDDRLARCMRGSQMSVRMLHTFLLTLWREGATQFDCGLSRDYSEILADLLVACLREEARVAPSAPAALFDRMCDAVERRIDDSSLSPHSLAEELGVSLRTLQGAVAEQGTTPNSYMVRRRMELAARKLTTDRVSNITCVAYDCGFSDSAYFSRRFRDFFGLSPSRYRSLH